MRATTDFDPCGLGHDPADLDAVGRLPGLAPPGPAVEVGSFAGASTLRLVAGRGAWGDPLYCVDTWRGSPSDKTGPISARRDVYAAFRANLGPRLLAPVVPLVGPSLEWAGRFRDAGIRPALVYVDAEHTREAVAADLAAWGPLVRPGGVLAGHDYGDRRFPGVAAAVDAFRAADPGRWGWLGVSGATVWALRRGGGD